MKMDLAKRRFFDYKDNMDRKRKKKKRLINQILKYGQLSQKIFFYIIDSLEAGYVAGVRHQKGILLSDIFEVGKKIYNQLLDSEKKQRIKRVLKKLERQEIIKLVQEDDKVYVYLKNENHPRVIRYSIKSILNFKKKEKKWNKRWVVIFFDVPENQRNKRDHLRRFLKEIGFYQYQKSVYIFPYDCRREINLIKRIIAGGKYLKYIIAEKIEDEQKIKNFFGLD